MSAQRNMAGGERNIRGSPRVMSSSMCSMALTFYSCCRQCNCVSLRPSLSQFVAPTRQHRKCAVWAVIELLTPDNSNSIDIIATRSAFNPTDQVLVGNRRCSYNVWAGVTSTGQHCIGSQYNGCSTSPELTCC